MYVGYVTSDGFMVDRYGLRSVLTSTGDIKLLPNEDVLYHRDDFSGWVKDKWEDHGFMYLLDDSAGKGTIYITNMRIAFVRTPKMYVRHEMMSAFGMASEVANILKQRNLRKSGMKEFFELPLDEICIISQYAKYANFGHVYILSKSKDYYMEYEIGITQKEMDILKQFLKHKLVKTETKGLFSKKTWYWYVDPEEIKKLKRKPGKVSV